MWDGEEGAKKNLRWRGLVVENKAGVGFGTLHQVEAVVAVAVAAGDDLGGELGDGANGAWEVGGVLGGDLEGDGLDDAVVLPQVVVGDIDLDYHG